MSISSSSTPSVASSATGGSSTTRANMALQRGITLIYTLALLWFFISISYQDPTTTPDIYVRMAQMTVGLLLSVFLVLTGYEANARAHLAQLTSLAIMLGIIVYAARDPGILKNALVFWPFLIPLVFDNRAQAARVLMACDALWLVVLGTVVVELSTNLASGSIIAALFGDSLKSIFSERTWTGVFFGMYGLLYFDRWVEGRRRWDGLRATTSITLALITVSFAVILGIVVITLIRIYRKRPLLSATLAFFAILALLFVPFSRGFETLDMKLGNRNVAFVDEYYLYRSAWDYLFGFLYPPQAGLDYEQMPGVPTIGIDSFSLPTFVLNNFGFAGVLEMFLIGRGARSIGNMGWSMVFVFIVGLIHPVHLQPGFMLLLTLLSVSGSVPATSRIGRPAAGDVLKAVDRRWLVTPAQQRGA